MTTTRRKRREPIRRPVPAVLKPPATSPVDRCRTGNPRNVCCVGTPWNNPDLEMQVRAYGEPLPQDVIDAAAELDLDPHDLDWHLEALHGVEPHNDRHMEAVYQAAACMRGDGCSN